MTQEVCTLRAAIVEDHRLIAHSVRLALQAAGIDSVVPRLSSAEQVLADICSNPPDVVLLDLDLGDRVGTGENLLPTLVQNGIAVIVLTAVTDRHRLAATLEAGAVGFLNKSAPFDVLVDSVRRAATGEPLIREDERHQLLAELRMFRAREWTRTSMFQRLTHREQQVLGALCEGNAVDDIAEKSCVSVATVRSQVRAILTKLNVNSQLTAVALVRKTGWQPPE